MTALVLSLFSSLALATWDGSTESYEVSSKLIQLPSSIAGSVILRPCSGCEPKTHRVSSGTRYEVSGRAVSLQALKEALRKANSRGELIVIVGYDTNTKLATKISLL